VAAAKEPINSDEEAQQKPRVDGARSEGRDAAGDKRDLAAEQRDAAATQRDADANGRDLAAELLESTRDAAEEPGAGSLAEGAGRDRSSASEDRAEAERDRTKASSDRWAAAVDRRTSAHDRAATALDELTSAHRRGPGFLELEREMARARRLDEVLTLAFVDVDGLKAVNDGRGHAAGDRLLRQVVDSLRAHLRPYDVIIRYGGDEFVCVLSRMDAAQASKRLDAVNTFLLMAPEGPASVTFGVTELRATDSLDQFIARGDQALYKKKRAPESGS
jgi:diguanylate cyclase (GGDEF)-like protein